MLDTADNSRRRELQRRAYAPGGRLSDAEAVELRELNDRQRGVEAGPSTGSGTEEVEAAEERGTEPVEVPAKEGDSPALVAEPVDVPAATHVRRRWLAPLAVALTLLIGFGAGWLTFGRDDGATAMTDAQRDRWVELEASNAYDPGSVQLIGAGDGADVWHATKSDADFRCILLTVGAKENVQCQPNGDEFAIYGLQTSLNFESDDTPIVYWAMMAESTTGDLVAVVQRQENAGVWDWRSQYSDHELAIVDFLVAEGHQGEVLQVLGYDGDLPVWLSESGETCLLVATAETILGEACGELGIGTDESLDLAMPDTVYSVHTTENRGPTLTIIRTGASADTAVGDCVGCASIDDKTGAMGE